MSRSSQPKLTLTHAFDQAVDHALRETGLESSLPKQLNGLTTFYKTDSTTENFATLLFQSISKSILPDVKVFPDKLRTAFFSRVFEESLKDNLLSTEYSTSTKSDKKKNTLKTVLLDAFLDHLSRSLTHDFEPTAGQGKPVEQQKVIEQFVIACRRAAVQELRRPGREEVVSREELEALQAAQEKKITELEKQKKLADAKASSLAAEMDGVRQTAKEEVEAAEAKTAEAQRKLRLAEKKVEAAKKDADAKVAEAEAKVVGATGRAGAQLQNEKKKFDEQLELLRKQLASEKEKTENIQATATAQERNATAAQRRVEELESQLNTAGEEKTRLEARLQQTAEDKRRSEQEAQQLRQKLQGQERDFSQTSALIATERDNQAREIRAQNADIETLRTRLEEQARQHEEQDRKRKESLAETGALAGRLTEQVTEQRQTIESLRQELQSLRTSNQRSTETNQQEFEKRLAAQQQAHAQEIARLRQQLEAETKQKNEALEREAGQKQYLSRTIATLRTQDENIASQADELRRIAAENERLRNALTEERRGSEAALARAQQQQQQIEQLTLQAFQATASSDDQRTNFERERAAFRTEQQRAEAAMNQRLESLTREHEAALIAQREQHEGEKQALVQQMRDMRAGFADEMSQLSAAHEQEKSQLTEALREQTEKNTLAQRAIFALREENMGMKTSLREYQLESNKQKIAIRQLQGVRAQKDEDIRRWQDEVTELQSGMEDLKEKFVTMGRKFQNQISQMEQEQEQISRTTAQRETQYEGYVAKQAHRIRNLERLLAEREAELAERDEEIQDVRGSAAHAVRALRGQAVTEIPDKETMKYACGDFFSNVNSRIRAPQIKKLLEYLEESEQGTEGALEEAQKLILNNILPANSIGSSLRSQDVDKTLNSLTKTMLSVLQGDLSQNPYGTLCADISTLQKKQSLHVAGIGRNVDRYYTDRRSGSSEGTDGVGVLER